MSSAQVAETSAITNYNILYQDYPPPPGWSYYTIKRYPGIKQIAGKMYEIDHLFT